MSAENRTGYFQNDFAEFWIEDGKLFFVYKQGAVINLEAARMIVRDRLTVQQGTPYPVYCDMRGIRDSDKAARDFLAKEGSSMVTAVGVLVGSAVTRMMLNFYLTISRPVTPTRMFTDEKELLLYLESFKKRKV